MKNYLWICLIIITLSGCSLTKDGVGFTQSPPDAAQVAQRKAQLEKNASASTEKQSNVDSTRQKAKSGIIVIGTAGALTKVADLDKYYAGYAAAAEKWHPGQPPIQDAATFKRTTIGYTSLEVSSTFGLYHRRKTVLVGRDMAEKVGFASAFGSSTIGTTGDLIAAKTNDDNLMYIDRVLCVDNDEYRSCAKNYQRGFYDAGTGQEIGNDFKPKSGGARIDPLTYSKIKKSN